MNSMNDCCNHGITNHLKGDYYACPMHPEVRQNSPGICPHCGMNLLPVKKDKGGENKHFDKHAGHKTKTFLGKFWLALVLTVPILFYSDLARTLFAWQAPDFIIFNFQLSALVPLVLGSVIFFYAGWIFISSAWRELKSKSPGMMTLIALAISVAYLYSVYAVLTGRGRTLFWELATLILVMLLGHWLEMKAVSGTQNALKELSKLLPDTAELVTPEGNKTVPISELKVGDEIFVRPGARIPADGTVIEGSSDVDESTITGESKPVRKEKGDRVIAAAINADGSLKIKITEIGENTFFAGVMKLVKDAQASKSKLQILSDRVAFYLTIVAIAAGIATLMSWLFIGKGFSFGLERMVAVLVITCPHALGLAIPLVASISTSMAARRGFLVRQRLALEAARKIDVILFDKTGTLTKGEYGVDEVVPDERVLQLAASVDSHSEHFISKAIVSEAKKRNLDLLPVANFTRIAGKGVKGTVNGVEVLAGGEAILREAGVSVADDLKQKAGNLAKQGKTIIYVISGGKLAGIIALSDLVREESKEALNELKKMGLKLAMITGDSEETAGWVAKQLGIDEYFAKVLPQDKVEKVKVLQKRGLKVAMVGDGINDAPALVQADLGVAVGAGTNVAIESAGIILVRNNPRDIAGIMRLSRFTYGKMVQNLFWAMGYNVVAMPLAAGVLISKGIVLQPALAALLMSLSTVIVAVNAVLLRRKKI